MKTVIKFILALVLSSCASKKSIERKSIYEYKLQNITERFDAKKLSYIGVEKYCIGGVRIEKTNKKDCLNCYSKNEIYIFWSESHKTYVQKFDNCSEFNIVEISDFKPKEFLRKNTKELQTDKVKGYKIDEEISLASVHSCFRNFTINDGQIKYEKSFDVLDLTGKNENLNYKTNNNLKLIELEKKLNGIINKLENKDKFKRNKKTCHNTVHN